MRRTLTILCTLAVLIVTNVAIAADERRVQRSANETLHLNVVCPKLDPLAKAVAEQGSADRLLAEKLGELIAKLPQSRGDRRGQNCFTREQLDIYIVGQERAFFWWDITHRESILYNYWLTVLSIILVIALIVAVATKRRRQH